MKRMYWAGLVFFVGSLALSWPIIQKAHQFQLEKTAYSTDLNYRNRFLDPDEWVNPEKAAAKLERAQEKADELQVMGLQIRRSALYLGAWMAVYLGFFLLVFRRNKNYRQLVFGWIILALACLPVGLFAPMLEISAFEQDLDLGDIPISARVMGLSVKVEVSQQFPGALYFYYQSKSVIELIGLLFEQRNWVVGLSILLFSVLFPLTKVLVTLGLVFSDRLQQWRWTRFFVEKLGKWSMADVFVVAVFLAFLAFSNMQVGITTQSKVLVGLYFFLGYCLFSLLSSTWIGKWETKAS